MVEKATHPQPGEVRRDTSSETHPGVAPKFDVVDYLKHFRDMPKAAATDSSLNAGAVQADGSVSFHPKFDPKAGPDAHLKQFDDMYKHGTPGKDGKVHAQMEINGKLQDVTIGREKMGSANLMHVRDSEGRLMVRALERGGEWKHQTDAHGKEVSYYGKAYQNGVPEDKTIPSDRKPGPGRHPSDEIKPDKGKDREKDKPPTGNDSGVPPKDSHVIKTWNNVDLTVYFSGHKAGKGEGGRLDQADHKLYSVEEFLKDPSKAVSVAVDRSHMPHYGQNLSIPELDRKFAKELNQLVAEGKLTEPKIRFTAVDNGPAVNGKHHIDICLAKYKSERWPDEHIAYGTKVDILDTRSRI